jgi:hypothetical protein
MPSSANASVRLEDLNPEPPAGLSEMAKAHADGLRKAVDRLKAHLNDRQEAPDVLRVAVLTYLNAWAERYAEGTRVLGLGNVERTILVIRQDTVQQMVAELGKPTG